MRFPLANFSKTALKLAGVSVNARVLVCTSFIFFAFVTCRISTFNRKYIYTHTSSAPNVVCERFLQNHNYLSKEHSSFEVTLNVTHLDTRHKNSKGWLSQEGEDRWLYEHFFHGVESRLRSFVEIGGLDGVLFSNTYIFEKAFGWKGVLIEAQTDNYLSLEKNRGQGESLTMHAAICKSERYFLEITGTGAIAGVNSTGKIKSRAPCLQMDDVLIASGIKRLDLLSLDVEGAELDVLQTMDFKSVPVFVILLEMRPVDEAATNPPIRAYLRKNGFCLFAPNVGHANEVWINPKFQNFDDEAKKPILSSTRKCENFLGRSSSSWLNQPMHDDYINIKCDIHLGSRPKAHTPWMGTTCEPWLTRCAINAIERVLRPTMHGLEWSCGSGTLWYLQRLASLHSIEHDESYMSLCQSKVQLLGEHLSNKWTPFHGSRNALVESNGSTVQSEYVSQAEKFERKLFDFIVIAGRNRTACLNFVLQHGLLREQDGILVLDNSERFEYSEGVNAVPKHWHRYDFATPVDTTTIWISQRMQHKYV